MIRRRLLCVLCALNQYLQQVDWQEGVIKLTRRMLVTYLVSFIAFSGVGLGFLFNPFSTKEAQAAWFNDAWAYRHQATFTHNANITSDRKVQFTLDTAELISAGLMQADCDDTRFTGSDGTIYKFDLTGTCNNASTTYEVIFPKVYNGSNLFYVYYGNPSAVNVEVDSTNYTNLDPSGGDPTLTNPTTSGNQEKGASPAAFWKFDDGQGQSAQDATSSNYDAQLGSTSGSDATDPLWRSEDRCVSGKCLEFDGSDDFVDAGTNSTLNATTNFSVSFWMKLTSYSGTQVMISKGTQGNFTNWHILYISGGATNQKVYFGIYNGATTYFNFEPVVGRWYHLTATLTQSGGNSIINTYVNGQFKSTQTGSSLSNVSGKNLYIGQYSDSGAQNLPFNGFLDEVKYYNYPLSASQVLSNYNSVANPDGVAIELSGSAQNSKSTLSDGLVGYWKMDEASANSCSGGANDSCDSSGLGIDGAWSGNTFSTIGRYGYSASFDGSGDYTTIPSNTSYNNAQYTVSWWMVSSDTITGATFTHPIYKSTNALNAANYAFSWDHTTASFQQACTHSVGGNFTGAAKLTTSLATNTWYHITCSYDGTNLKAYLNGKLEAATAMGTPDTGNSNLYIGTGYAAGVSGQFDGEIDEVRVYNRALSDSEILGIYSWSQPPVGHWKMDERTGQTVNDSTVNGNNGTLGADSSTSTDDPLWKSGRLGGSANFDGVDDFINIPDPSTGVLDIVNPITVSAWIKYTSGTYRAIASKGAGSCSTNCPFDFYVSNTGTLTLVRAGAVVWYGVNSTTTVPSGQWVHVAATADGQFIRTYINGVEQVGATIAGSQVSYVTPTANASPVRVGLRSDAVTKMLGDIDDLRIYDYARTASQIFEDMNGGHPAPGSPVSSAVAHWKFDEGYGTTANDSTPNDNDLTLSTATSAWTRSGKFGNAWDGNASRYLSRADDVDLEFFSGEDYSISLWYKSDNAANPGATEYLINKANATTAGYAVYANTSGNLCFGIDDDASWGPDVASCTSTDVYDATWHHLVAVRNVTSDTTAIFIDGRQMDSDTDPTTANLTNSLSFYVGDRDGTDNGDEFNGDIDEIKVYRSALNQDQIDIDMNKSVSQALGARGDNTNFQPNANAQQYCIPGDTSTCTAPIGEWLFEERTGSTVNDTSGSANTGTWQGTLGNQWSAKGKNSTGGDFNGTDNYISVSDTSGLSSGTLSTEAWIYPRVNGVWAPIINRRNGSNQRGFTMEQNASTSSLQCQFTVNLDGNVNAQGTTVLTLNAWNHVACTFDGSTLRAYVNGRLEGTYSKSGSITNPASPSVQIGRNIADGTLFTGRYDQIRVYNYARSTAQIAYAASDGKPWAQWKMDECQGTTVNDSSGHSYSGTWNGSGGGTNTSVGTCVTGGTAWGDGASGKRNASLEFDGTDDYVQVSDTSNLRFDSSADDFSLFAWVKRATTGTEYLISKEDADNDGWRMMFNSSNQVVCSEDATDVTSSSAISDTNWHFVGCTIDRDGNGQVYIDAKPDGSAVAMGTDAMATTSNIMIGARSYTPTNFFSGQIDDVRISIYPLTQSEIELAMNQGGYRVGPVSGAP